MKEAELKEKMKKWFEEYEDKKTKAIIDDIVHGWEVEGARDQCRRADEIENRRQIICKLMGGTIPDPRGLDGIDRETLEREIYKNDISETLDQIIIYIYEKWAGTDTLASIVDEIHAIEDRLKADLERGERYEQIKAEADEKGE